MKIICSFLTTLFLLPTFAQAGTLIVNVDGETLVPFEWSYRSIARRGWIPGCTWYDVLQGTGFFPATYYYDYTPTQEGNTYTFKTSSGFWRFTCGARMDQYNYVRLRFDTGGDELGFFRLIPEGESSEANVVCRVDETKPPEVRIQCDHPVVKWSESGTTTINVTMES